MGSFKRNNEFFGHRIPDDCCILKDVDLLKVIKTEPPQFIIKKLYEFIVFHHRGDRVAFENVGDLTLY